MTGSPDCYINIEYKGLGPIGLMTFREDVTERQLQVKTCPLVGFIELWRQAVWYLDASLGVRIFGAFIEAAEILVMVMRNQVW